MSTFNGFVSEFPDICIDHFRPSPHRPPVLTGFLSHVHTDHTVGLDSWRSPFIYCSPATKEIMLRLETQKNRMNFARGVLESRQQHFRHLRKVLKPIPLERPTVLELSPGRTIRFTLIDANHCVGAVMFLIQGDGKSVLYTGDIRCETWWLDKLARSPALIPYFAFGNGSGLKQLDNMYLDTTFVAEGKADPYKTFPSKLSGIQELLSKVFQYPNETKFYFDSWTFGYEDVWDALAQALDEQIHVDKYRFSLYRALADSAEMCKAPEATTFSGYPCGNHIQQGILTNKQESRLHSCEKGTECDIWKQDFVRITPIITRFNGVELEELGAGGGKGDLDQRFELELTDGAAIEKLVTLCASKLSDSPRIVLAVLEKLQAMIENPVNVVELNAAVMRGDSSTQGDGEMVDVDQIPIERLIPALVDLVKKDRAPATKQDMRIDGGLPRRITFPYSRHSSYAELCMLIDGLKPKDIHPCTVDTVKWTPTCSMGYLFGHLYSEPVSFSHDQTMMRIREREPEASPAAVSQSSDVQPTLPNFEQIATTGDVQVTDARYEPRTTNRQEAYEAALGASSTWHDIRLLSTSSLPEEEL